MPLTIDWSEIALRLALAMLGGALLGINRTERGMAAGLRTTLLVSLAAAVAMIQVNLLLATSGKQSDSFVTFDPMRLPLGVLTGMGFIGGGAILQKGDRISGVTTAATLWLATMLGLCFGGGQHGLGLAALALGSAVLWLLKSLEAKVAQERRGRLSLTVTSGGPTDDEVRAMIETGGMRSAAWRVVYAGKGKTMRRKISCEVHWRGRLTDPPIPEFVRQLVDRTGVRMVQWRG